MARLSGKELQVRQEVFDVCDSLLAKGYELPKDYTFDALKVERVNMFGKGGHYETLKRYRDEWLMHKGLNVKTPVMMTLGEDSQADVPGVYGAFDKFLEDRTVEIKAEFQQAYESQLYNIQKERDAAIERTEAAFSQQKTFKLMLDRKQAEIDGFSVMAKAHLEKSGKLERVNAQMAQELQRLTKRLEIIEHANEKKITSIHSQYETQLTEVRSEKEALVSQFERTQKHFNETNDKLLEVNEKQRIDAMNERVALEDKLNKSEKSLAKFKINSESKVGEYRALEGALSQKITEIEKKSACYSQENLGLQKKLKEEQEARVRLEALLTQQDESSSQFAKLTELVKSLRAKPTKSAKK